MLNIAALPAPSVDAGLSKYLTEIRKFPILRPEQELAYAKRWREYRDSDAAYQLVTSHLRLVAKIAMRYRGYGLPIADIVSEGCKQQSEEIVLQTAASQERAISALQDGDLRPEQVRLIAERLKVAERDVVTMDRRLGGDVSLNVPIHDEDDNGQALDWLVDSEPTQEITLAEEQEATHRHRALNSAIADLNPRERRIFKARWLTDDPATLEDLAAEYGVSRERIRQIEQRAFQKVKGAMQALGHVSSGPASLVPGK